MDTREVAQENFDLGLSPVLVAMLSATQGVRFIHPDVDPPRRDRIRPELHHLGDERVSAVVAGKQDRALVPNRMVALPAQHLLHVTQGLDAGHEFNAEQGGIAIQLAHVLFRVAAALVAKERLALQLEGIFRIEHQEVEPEQRHAAHPLLEVMERRDGIA